MKREIIITEPFATHILIAKQKLAELRLERERQQGALYRNGEDIQFFERHITYALDLARQAVGLPNEGQYTLSEDGTKLIGQFPELILEKREDGLAS